MSVVDSPELDRSSQTRHVLRCAVASRILLISLIILWRSIVDPYDTSAVLNPSCLSSSNGSDSDSDPSTDIKPLWPSIGSKIEGSIVWDGVYFTRIAQCGYEYEQTYAFLPLFPICMRVLSRTVFRPLVPLIGIRAVLAVSGYLLNVAAFSFAAVYMFKLSLLVLKDSEAALQAAILFCFNPASIFYSSVYSESLYSLLSVGGVYHLLSSEKNLAVILLALSGSVRSNGILNAGYVCFETLHQTFDAIVQRKSAFAAVRFLFLGVLRSILIFVPFAAFQAYGYYNICLGRKLDEVSPWCSARVPLLYNYIQSRYWGVGFLKYFQLKQLPNFLLASPILALAICSIVHFVRLRPSLFTSLGFKASNKKKNELFSFAEDQRPSKFDIATTGPDNQHLRKRRTVEGSGTKSTPADTEVSTRLRYCSVYLVPFTLHLAFMVLTAFFVMHVQVSTRFLSASPPLYWFASSHIMMTSGDSSNSRRWASYLICTYSATYIFLGSLLFSNFYPFT